MSLEKRAFFFFLFFLVGLFLSSLNLKTFYLIGGELFFFLVLLFWGVLKSDKFFLSLAFLSLFLLMGWGWGKVFNFFYFSQSSLEYNKVTLLEGKISSYPKVNQGSINFLLKTSQKEVVFVSLPPFYSFGWGDFLKIRGKIQRLEENNRFLMKDKVKGVVFSPEVLEHKRNPLFSLKRELFYLREKLSEVFRKVFPQDEAALATGLLLGQESAGFSSSFKEFLRKSGTSHLVALSGYNVLILINAMHLFLGFFFKRKTNFFLSLFVIFLFVLMTGAEASLVRASLMGGLILLAENLSRIPNFLNLTLFSAWIMALFNPKIFFDVGFLLSFLAFLGISYGGSSLDILFSFKSSFWDRVKKIFFETFSAQVAVLPILVIYFGNFSWMGFVSNIFLLPLIPLTMFLSFLVGGGGIISLALAKMISLLLWPLIRLEVDLIKFFGSFTTFSFSAKGWVFFVYYLILFCLGRWIFKKANEEKLKLGLIL
ncbi:MAG: hypothetical protein KatS3mg098_232 [Candidatus Parcubacteria bacterium]|nr:MAG: hypothetical protein KatS3mg098_232 [Candidatus Parcubacteria bacterium]